MDAQIYNSVMEKAADYLLNYIEEHGRWEDFYIARPGVSDQWVTAYVGNCLLETARQEHSRHQAALHQAAEFLISAKKPDGGWGYNINCRSDCDSTAHALWFLAKMAYPIEKKSIECICRFFKPDGGFATYLNRSSGSWNDSHIDVTLMAASLLRDVFIENPPAYRQLQAYVKGWFQKYDLPPAFWWDSRYYTALSGVYFCQRYGLAYPRDNILAACVDSRPAEQAFDMALCLELMAVLGAPAQKQMILYDKLISMQKPDGSFPGGKILRVTKPDCHNPWRQNDHTIAEDIHSLFTTAAVLRALGIYRKNHQQ